MNIVVFRFLLSLLTKVALVYAVSLLGLTLLQLLLPRAAGAIALSQIVAPYLFLPLLLALPLALQRHTGLLKLALVACTVIFCLRFGPSLVSVPQTPFSDARQIGVMSWNVYRYNRQPEHIRRALHASPAQIVALQELSPKQARMLASDPILARRYPYQLLRPQGLQETSLISRYPILEDGRLSQSDTLWAQLDLGDGQRLNVVAAHPPSGDIPKFRRLRPLHIPRSFDPEDRDEHISGIRRLIDSFLEQEEPLLVLGDFNVTDREPTYRKLTAGLLDAHRRVGQGPGHTWRPWKRLPVGVLRIDYLLSSPTLAPLRTSVDCTPHGSDHCIVHGTFAIRSMDGGRPTTNDE